MVVDFLEGLAVFLDGPMMIWGSGRGGIGVFFDHLLWWDGGNVFILILNRILNLALVHRKEVGLIFGAGTRGDREKES